MHHSHLFAKKETTEEYDVPSPDSQIDRSRRPETAITTSTRSTRRAKSPAARLQFNPSVFPRSIQCALSSANHLKLSWRANRNQITPAATTTSMSAYTPIGTKSPANAIDCKPPSHGTCTGRNTTSSARRRASLDFLSKMMMSPKSSSLKSLVRNNGADDSRPPSPLPRRSSLGLLQGAVSCTSLRSLYAKQDDAATDTATTGTSATMDNLDVTMYHARPRPRRTSSIRGGQTRDSFELMVRSSPDVLDGGQYRPREMTIEELVLAIECAR